MLDARRPSTPAAPSTLAAALAVAVLGGATTATHAQDEAASSEPPAAPTTPEADGEPTSPMTSDLPPVSSLVADEPGFRLGIGYEWQDDSPLVGPGRVGIQRASLDAAYEADLGSSLSVALGLEYDLDVWDFKGETQFAEEWEEIHQLALSATFALELDNDWDLYGGPIVRYAGESGASLSDSYTLGGFAGVRWEPSPDVTVGLGLAVVEEIEDSARFFPIVQLDWEFVPDWRLRSTPVSFNTGGTEFQLAWQADRSFEVAAGLLLNHRPRFRLDDDGAIADAVAREEGRWLYLRGTWAIDDDVEVTASVGYALEPEVRLSDADGDRLAEDDYDEALSLGARLSIRF